MGILDNTIHVVNGYEDNSYTYYPVLIIGAGQAGIALGCCLKEELGFDQFRIFDRQAGAGGVWWVNRYPGVACDIPTLLYSYSFFPNYTSKTIFSPGSEIVQYLNEVCQHYGITDKIQLNTEISEIRWLEKEQLWEATLIHLAPSMGDLSSKEREKHAADRGEGAVCLRREKVRAKVVASGVGALVEPKVWPEDIPGVEQFEGDVFHTARFKHNVNLTGKDIILVGTGCSAAQVAPRLTKEPYNAKSVTHIMRSPPWVVPKVKEPFGKEKFAKHSPVVFKRFPFLGRLLRTHIFFATEYDFQRLFFNNKRSIDGRKQTEARLLAHMRKTVPEKYHEILTPNYGIGCKRRIFDDEWFSSMDNPAYNLTTQPLTSVQPRGVTLGPGRLYPSMNKIDSKASVDEVQLPADVIILANGFEASKWMHPLQVYGKDDKLLSDVWEERGGPQAYLGTAMDGFPNFFLLFGPNNTTGHSSVILASENLVEYSIKFIKQILNGDVRTFEVKKSAEIKWTTGVQKELKDTVWMNGGCSSWYKTEDGWNSSVYPRSQIDFSLRCMFPKWSDWNIVYTRKGLLKQRLRETLRLAALAALIVVVYKTKRAGKDLKSLTGIIWQYGRLSLITGLELVSRGIVQMQRHL